ncbi:MAG: hypothetical protein Q9184_003645 [Pyrenodesmia sp. 2 TL-2023]
MSMSTNSLYCAICGAPFELPDICDHEDAVHENPADDDDSYSICRGLAYDSRKLCEGETRLIELCVIGSWIKNDTKLVNRSTSTHFYILGPARRERRDHGESNMPFVPDRHGHMLEIEVYDAGDPNGILFPIHEACWEVLGRLCTVRQLQQSRDGTLSKPDTPERFCDAFAECRRRNLQVS